MTDLIILWLHIYALIFLIGIVYAWTKRPPQAVAIPHIGIVSVYLALFVTGLYSIVRILF